jgi:hypothetical protein
MKTSALSLPLLATAALAQADFTQLAPTNAPSARAGMIGVSDGALLYSFGGKPGPGVEFNDMWVFNGVDWVDITPAAGALPPGRDWYAATFDLARGVYVLFGGRSSALGSNLGDTWEFNGATWTQLTPATSPSPRRWAQMTYDPGLGACVLFGGADGSNYYGDTWSWDGVNWTQLSPASSPSPRARGRMSTDLVSGETVYFGGRNATTVFGDTWIWSGGNWTQVTTPNAPSSAGVPGRFAYGMTYDALRDRHVLFGGTRNGPTLSDVWEFDGVDWAQRAASGPSNRTGPTFAYVLGLGKTFLYGGFGGPQQSDTWEYQTSALPAVATTGSGCTGPGGSLTLTSTAEPWTDSVWTGECANVGAGSLAFSVLGLPAPSFPLSLAVPVAGAGCTLENSAAVLLGPAIGTGAPLPIQVQVVVPASPLLAGFQFDVQVAEFTFDPTGNWGGLYSSNGLSLTVGVR